VPGPRFNVQNNITMKSTSTIGTDMHSMPQTFLLPASTPLTEEAVKLLHDMFTNLHPFDVRNTLLELYHTYVRHEHGNLPINFDEMTAHFFCLDNILKLLTEKQLSGNADGPA